MQNIKKQNAQRVCKLLEELVDIYSPSGKEEEIVEYVGTSLKKYDIPFEYEEVTEGRYNIHVIPEKAQNTQTTVGFVGHIDTVPAFDIETYESVRKNDELYGLGAADMKGGCAAMIEAFIRYKEKYSVLPPVSLHLLVGEEEWGDGATRMLEKYTPEWVIIGEPTNMLPCLTNFGYLLLVIRTFGTRRHASLAGHEYNAVFSMLKMLIALGENIEENYSDAVLNIRDLHSGESGFAVPDRCEAYIDIHFPPELEFDAAVKYIENVVNESLEEGRATRYDCDIELRAPGFTVDANDPFVLAVRNTFEMNGREWCNASFQSHSDASLFYEAGCKPIVLGPGMLEKAHTSDESIALTEVITAADIYFDLLTAVADKK